MLSIERERLEIEEALSHKDEEIQTYQRREQDLHREIS